MTDTSIITVPESLAYFFADEKNRQAVVTILEIKKAPSDLSWDDLEQYHLARLASEQVRVDYWRLALQVWRATWGQAFDANSLGLTEIKPEEYEGENQPSSVWDEDRLYLLFNRKKDGSTLYLGVSTNENSEVELHLYIEDSNKDYGISNSLPLSTLWKDVSDDDTRVTGKGLASLSSGKTVDLSKLQQAATDAVEALSKVLNKY